MCINIQWTDNEETVMRWDFPLFWKSEEITDALQETRTLLNERPLAAAFTLVVNANGNISPRDGLSCFKQLLNDVHPEHLILVNADALETALHHDAELSEFQQAIHGVASLPEAESLLPSLPMPAVRRVS